MASGRQRRAGNGMMLEAARHCGGPLHRCTPKEASDIRRTRTRHRYVHNEHPRLARFQCTNQVLSASKRARFGPSFKRCNGLIRMHISLEHYNGRQPWRGLILPTCHLLKGRPMRKTPQSSRVVIHDSPVHFRAKASLVEAAKELASERGMSLAELMRHALRREIGC
jgi:hypothetical protein